MAAERRGARVRQRRSDWFEHRLPAIADRPERVVFIDETSVKTNLTRLRGRALRGTGLTMDAPFGSWATQTLIAGLTPDALIAPWCIKGRNGQPRLRSLGSRGPDPIEPGTMVILDNLATHHNKHAAEALRAHRCWFLCLPPYSPDLNLIEINRTLSRTHGVRVLIFAKLKAHLRRIGARTFIDIFKAIGEVCDLFDPGECWNYCKAAGYVAG